MHSSKPVPSDETDPPKSDDVNVVVDSSSTEKQTVGIYNTGDFHARDVSVTFTEKLIQLGPALTKNDYWQNLTSGTGQVQEDSAARLIDLACDDAALADKLKQLLVADATPLKLKQVILRAMKACRWLERPPISLMQSLTLLSQSQEPGIRFSAANILRTCSSLPEK